MSSALKRQLPLSWQNRLRRVSRLRWITKYRIVRRSGVRLGDNPGRNLRYVLWDPEVESHSYAVDNEAELAVFVADFLSVSVAEVARHLNETKDDPELNDRLARRTRWRFDTKTAPEPANRLLWYALARSLKPRLIVEAGVYQGLGSLILLRALERNAEEGVRGELLSIDLDPGAGWIVEPRLTARWRRVVGTTAEVLERELEGRSVDMLIHDTPHTYENAKLEFDLALSHAADRLVLVDSSGGKTPALEETCAKSRGTRRHFRERPRDHFYPTSGSEVGLIQQDGEP